jgi:hypothetical protein
MPPQPAIGKRLNRAASAHQFDASPALKRFQLQKLPMIGYYAAGQKIVNAPRLDTRGRPAQSTMSSANSLRNNYEDSFL